VRAYLIIGGLLIGGVALAQTSAPLGPGNGNVSIAPLGPGDTDITTGALGPGSSGGGGGIIPPVGCTPTGLDFTNQCNSVYIVAIGF
jgi:hypothetical protein